MRARGCADEARKRLMVYINKSVVIASDARQSPTASWLKGFYMKTFWVVVTLFLFSLPAFSQGKTDIVIVGKDKGSVNSTIINGVTYVDALALIKKLGGEGRFAAQNKTLNIKNGSFAAQLTAGQRDVTVNGAKSLMSYYALEVKGKIYAPVNFFFNAKLSDAISRDISFEDGKIIVEKKYNLSFSEADANESYTLLTLAAKGDLKYTSEKKSVREARAVIEDAVLKRDIKLKFGSADFLYKAEIKQCKANVCMRFLLNKDTKNWAFDKSGRGFAFAAYNEVKPKALSAPATSPAVVSAPEGQVVLNRKRDADLTGAEDVDPTAFYSGAASVPVLKPAPATTIQPATKPALATSIHNNKVLRVVIDAGHGGKDPGAVRGNLKEKTINLEVAEQVTAILKKKKIEVKMTRDDDTFIPLHGRSKISNDYSADMFVSIHTNSSKKAESNGFSVYFRSDKPTDAEADEAAALENEALQYEETNFNFVDVLLRSLATNEHINESSKLAGYVRRSVAGTKSLGVKVQTEGAIKQANFYVLKGVDSPAILVEMAFISNYSDRKQLLTKEFRKKMAEGVANGILEYAKAEGYLQ